MSATATASFVHSDDGGEERLAEYDVTAWLLQSSCSLAVGQFLSPSDGSFSLHAAMSALELMDRRMDPGMANPSHTISPQQRQRVPDRQQQLQWDDRHVLLCADTLLCCLASHLNGLSLPHSLYTFTLLHRSPYQQQQQQLHYTARVGEAQRAAGEQITVFPLLHQPLLHVLARLMLHSCHAGRAIVSRADLYEEEEWNMHDYGLAIEQDGGGDALSKDATATELSLEAAVRADRKGKQQQQQPPHQQQTVRAEEKATNEQTAAGTYREALLDRLKLCHALLLLLSHLSKPNAALHTAHKLLSRTANQLHAVMHNTVMAPQRAAQHVHDLDTFRVSSDCPFDPSISASLILHAPPRLHPLLPLPAALTLLHQLLTHCSLLLASSSLPSLPSLLHFVTYFASQRPNIVLRSVLLLSLSDEMDVNRNGRSLLALLSDALHELSPSALLFASLSTRWAVFGPLPADLPAELQSVPPADLTSSWMAHMSTLVVQHFRLLLMDPSRERRKVGSALQLAVHLQPAAVSVDQWLSLACRRLRVEQADGAWYAMASHISAQQRRQLEEADRRILYGSNYYSLALDTACSLVLHQLTSLFSQQLAVDEELSVLYFAIQHYTHCKTNNARTAWRDDKLPSLVVEQLQQQQHSSTAALKKKRDKQQQNAYKSLSLTPPVTAETLLWESVALLSAGMQAVIHGLGRLKLPSGSQAVAVPLLPSSSLPTYFSNRFPWLPEQLAPALSAALYERQMHDDFAPSLSAQHILELSGRLFARAKEQLAALQQLGKQQPPLPACTAEALIGQSSSLDGASTSHPPTASPASGSEPASSSSTSAVLLPSARVVLLTDLSARLVLPFDGAFLHSLSRVAVANAVTVATAAKKTSAAQAASAEQSTVSMPPPSSDNGSPSFRARFSFTVNWLFPVISIETVVMPSRSAATTVR